MKNEMVLGKRQVGMCVCCWRRKEVVRCMETDAFDSFCSVCVVSGWVPGGLLMGALEAA